MKFKKLLLVLATIALTFQLQLVHAANPKVKMETSKGTMIIELYADKAPKSVANFLSYVNAGAYDGMLEENMIVCIESYVGEVDGSQGVKLEQPAWITAEGPVILSEYPLEKDF